MDVVVEAISGAAAVAGLRSCRRPLERASSLVFSLAQPRGVSQAALLAGDVAGVPTRPGSFAIIQKR
jgi:hypothetical protein